MKLGGWRDVDAFFMDFSWDFSWNLDGFWMDFGWIFHGILMDFAAFHPTISPFSMGFPSVFPTVFFTSPRPLETPG
jgi:hypothetical protein